MADKQGVTKVFKGGSEQVSGEQDETVTLFEELLGKGGRDILNYLREESSETISQDINTLLDLKKYGLVMQVIKNPIVLWDMGEGELKDKLPQWIDRLPFLQKDDLLSDAGCDYALRSVGLKEQIEQWQGEIAKSLDAAAEPS